MSAPLASIDVRGFRSIDRLTLTLTSDITLLIGANGAGKSNIVAAIELLGYAVDGKLGTHVLRSGGFSQITHRAPSGQAAESIEIEAWGAWNLGFRNGYRMTVNPGPDDTAYLTETTYTHGKKHDRPYSDHLGSGRESKLTSSADAHPAARYLLDVLSGCRVFHFDDTSNGAPPLRRSDVGDNETLHSDARNLASVLLDMREHHARSYDRVVRAIRNVAPFFDDFVLRAEGDSIALRWSERSIDGAFSGSALSSGTLRFICLAVLLQQPRPPATIVLDEPELGLHPAAIHQLAALFRSAADGRRIVAATQSVTLLGQFGIDEIAVVERLDGATTVDRPDPERLSAWLSDYSVGELWEKNLLGGRPSLRSSSTA